MKENALLPFLPTLLIKLLHTVALPVISEAGGTPMKKRHTLTLTEEHVVKFQEFCKEARLPPATLSNAVDDFIKEMVEMFDKVKATGKLTIRDIFELMGKQIELIQEEQLEKQTQKTKGMEKRTKKK
jgi:hypothetical protein